MDTVLMWLGGMTILFSGARYMDKRRNQRLHPSP
jgi:hypothetical protein